LKITAQDLFSLGLVDEIVPESPGGAHNDPAATAALLKASLLRNLEDVKKLSGPDRLKLRYDKFRAYGRFTEKIEMPAKPAAASAAASITPETEASKDAPPPSPSAILSFAAGNPAAAGAAMQF
jgi:hypothetical protein